MKEHYFILNGNGEWDVPKPKELFNDDSVDNILKIPLPISPSANKLIWVEEKRGCFYHQICF